MLFRKSILPFFLLLSTIIFSQEKIKHKVVKGESVYSIAKKYNVKPSDIFELNPNSKKTLSLNTVLMVPNKNYKPEEVSSNNSVVIHEVLAKETLYGISRKYKVSIDKIKEANPIIETEGLKLGSKITIPGANGIATYSTNAPVTEIKKEVKAEVKPEIKAIVESQNEGEQITHQVLPKETKYGISKRYKITIQELERLNPEIVNDLPIGYQLVIRKGSKSAVAQNSVSPQMEEEEEQETETASVSIPTSSSSQMKIIEVKESDNTPVVPVEPLSLENMSKADFLIAKASENIGVRYRSGGTSKAGFDCSGLMTTTFKEIELALPRSSREQSSFGTRISRGQAQKGDLIFFTTNGRGNINHVGMVVEVLEDEIKFIHSSVQAGVIISSTKEAYYSKRFVQVNRVLVN